MHGIPKYLQTREDYDRAVDLARSDRTLAPKALRHFQGLLAGRFAYEFDRELAADDVPDGAEPDYLVLPESDDSPRRQLVRREQAGARIFALGYAVAEVEEIISELESMR